MKKIKTLLVYCGIFTMLFASCSKDEPVQMDPSNEDSYATLTFNSLLNDLSNKAMQKAQFSDIPDCMDGTPTSVEITLKVDGEATNRVVTVDVLGDAVGGYFTAYSDLLKIKIANDGDDTTEDSVDFTLLGFKVFAGADLLWVAPVRTTGDINQFAGYVEKSLPFEETVYRGTKPYFNVEVLCFDRRMVNEYGYVFFDIVPKTLYPLCLFANYCNADGRHWVADYSIDLYYGPTTSGIQLYSNTQNEAMASTSIVQGQFQADPLCLVVPGPPANLPAGDDYLTLVVYPMDWIADGSYGNIDNSGVEIQLSWTDVNGLLNADGTTNEYLHILLGECEEALSGDGTLNPGEGNGNGECDPLDPAADCDGDLVRNGVDECPTTPKLDGQVAVEGKLGCWKDPDTGGVCINESSCDIPAVEFPCLTEYLGGADTFVETDTEIIDAQLIGANDIVIGLIDATFVNGELVVTISPSATFALSGYVIEVRPLDATTNEMSTVCKEFRCEASAGLTASETFENIGEGDTFFIRVKAIICPPVLPS